MGHRKHRDDRGRGGFARRELLVVVAAVLVLLMLILPPAIQRARFRAKCLEMMNDGKNVYAALFAEESNNPFAPDASVPFWQRDGRPHFQSAGDLFHWRSEMESERASRPIIHSSKPALPPNQWLIGLPLSESFTAWCATLNLDSQTKAATPVIFSQNFKFKTRGPEATLDQMIGLEPKARPFGDEAGIVITRGGAGVVLDAKTATQTHFNPAGATNGFLWPLASGQDVSR